MIVKAHPAHPGTSELVGQLLLESVRECGLPEGVFSLLFDSGNKVGIALVRHPLVKAVGFTGSRNGGRALMDVAAARPDPIPVFAEMSSLNPVFLLPGAQYRDPELSWKYDIAPAGEVPVESLIAAGEPQREQDGEHATSEMTSRRGASLRHNSRSTENRPPPSTANTATMTAQNTPNS